MKSRHFNYLQSLTLSFFCMILLGGCLLTLPIASVEPTGFLDALFTSVSATCVTGLIVFDTATHWTLFGKAVILLLIQLGGLGFMFVMSFLGMLTGKKLELHERKMLMESTGALRLSGVVRLLRRVSLGTFLIEGCGALLLAIRFCPELGVGRGACYAIFHSVSAFCNAGFDLLGYRAPFSSVATVATDPLVMLTLSFLIVLGGLGFFVWTDLLHCGRRFSKWNLQTKIVMATSGILMLGGTVLFFLLESNASMANLPLGGKLLNAWFQSATVRTAGFDAVGQGALSEGGLLLSVCLMLIGGSPGSTAGGIKTTTAAILFMNVVATVRKKPGVEIANRCIDAETVRQAIAIFFTYIAAVIAGSLLLCVADPVECEQAVFECTSAIATVGLTTGITTTLSAFSRVVLMLMMFAGRVGGLSLILVFFTRKTANPLQRPTEHVSVG